MVRTDDICPECLIEGIVPPGKIVELDPYMIGCSVKGYAHAWFAKDPDEDEQIIELNETE